MKQIQTASLYSVVISLACLWPNIVGAQGCDSTLVDIHFPQPTFRLDSINIKGVSEYPAHKLAASIDETGHVVYLRDGECLAEGEAGTIDPEVFESLRARLEEAVEDVSSQPDRPNLSRMETLRVGRIEGICMAAQDLTDYEIQIYDSGDRIIYSCVSGALREFGYEFLRMVTEVLQTDVGRFGSRPFP